MILVETDRILRGYLSDDAFSVGYAVPRLRNVRRPHVPGPAEVHVARRTRHPHVQEGPARRDGPPSNPADRVCVIDSGWSTPGGLPQTDFTVCNARLERSSAS